MNVSRVNLRFVGKLNARNAVLLSPLSIATDWNGNLKSSRTHILCFLNRFVQCAPLFLVAARINMHRDLIVALTTSTVIELI